MSIIQCRCLRCSLTINFRTRNSTFNAMSTTIIMPRHAASQTPILPWNCCLPVRRRFHCTSDKDRLWCLRVWVWSLSWCGIRACNGSMCSCSNPPLLQADNGIVVSSRRWVETILTATCDSLNQSINESINEQKIRSMERVSAQCSCIQYTVIEIFDCNCNDLELGRFKVIQGQR